MNTITATNLIEHSFSIDSSLLEEWENPHDEVRNQPVYALSNDVARQTSTVTLTMDQLMSDVQKLFGQYLLRISSSQKTAALESTDEMVREIDCILRNSRIFYNARTPIRSIPELRWSREEAFQVRSRLLAFEEGWNAPGMEKYDAL